MIKQWVRRLCLVVAMGLSAVGVAHAAIDVNTADEAALTSIKGIGPATAKHILEERNKRGPYKDASDLAERVSGIGPKSVARMQDAGLTFGSTAAAAPATPAAVAKAPRGAVQPAAAKPTR